MSTVVAVCGISAVIIGGLSVAYIAARVYLRASQIQQIWLLRIDSLSQHSWDLLYDRLSAEEFQYVAKRLEMHNLERSQGSRDAAPTVREVLRNTP